MRARILLLGLLSHAAAGCGEGPRDALHIAAAASLRDVMLELGTEFRREHPIELIYNFAGSNVLAKQIGAAPRADVFLSADEAWVDYLEELGRTRRDSRRSFLANTLVVVAHAEGAAPFGDPRALAELDFRCLALGHPEAVPAGRYAKRWLQSVPLGDGSLWERLESRICPALDVRRALALVTAQPDVIGIVYASDTHRSETTRILYSIPNETIRYTAVLIEKNSRSPAADLQAQAFLDYLRGDRARALFRRHGFLAPKP